MITLSGQYFAGVPNFEWFLSMINDYSKKQEMLNLLTLEYITSNLGKQH